MQGPWRELQKSAKKSLKSEMAAFTPRNKNSDQQVTKLLKLLKQLDPMEHQRESDRRYAGKNV